MLVYHPASGAFNFGAALEKEGVINLLEGLLAAWLLSLAAAGKAYSARAGFVVILGVLASVTTTLEYWNWYDFPGNYVAGYIVTQIIGFTLVGLVVAAFVKSEVAPGS